MIDFRGEKSYKKLVVGIVLWLGVWYNDVFTGEDDMIEFNEFILLSDFVKFLGGGCFDVEEKVKKGGSGVYELMYGCRGGYEGIVKNDMMDEWDDNIDCGYLEVRDVYGKDMDLDCMMVVMYGEEDVRVFVDIMVDEEWWSN